MSFLSKARIVLFNYALPKAVFSIKGGKAEKINVIYS
jgi:hypothetical protein